MSEAIEKKRAILAKIESSYGVDPTATGAANAVLGYIRGWRPQQMVHASRAEVALPAMGRFASKPAYSHAEIDLDIEITGAAAAGTPPPYGPLLRACGLSETIVAVTSVTYAPISAAHESAAVYANIDGMQQKLLGLRAGLSIAFANEEIPYYRLRGMALYAAPTDTALPALTLTAHQAPKPVNRTNTTASAVHGYTVGLQSAEIDLGLEVQYFSLPNGTNKVLIVNRAPTWRMTIEHPTMAQKDFNALVASGATGALSIVHGTVAGAICTFSAAQASILSATPAGSVKGVRMMDLSGELAPSNALNDEVSIAYS